MDFQPPAEQVSKGGGNAFPWFGELWKVCQGDARVDWRALTTATDLDGERVWSRQDNFYDPAGWVASTVGEYVITTTQGETVIITDEFMGLEFLYISEFSDVKCESEYASAWGVSVGIFILFGIAFGFI